MRAAGASGGLTSRTALAELCQAYWYPLYSFVRYKGNNAEDASDLTQAFFTRLLEKNDIAMADEARGRFRSFLLSALTHFLANEHDWARRLKRGGDKTHVSFDPPDAEARYSLEPSHGLTPERLFDRQWAMVLLEQVLAGLGSQYERDGKRQLFESLKGTLTFLPDAPSYEQIGRALAMTPGAVKVAVHRLRNQYRQCLRQTIAESVSCEAEVDAEIRDLFEVFKAG